MVATGTTLPLDPPAAAGGADQRAYRLGIAPAAAAGGRCGWLPRPCWELPSLLEAPSVGDGQAMWAKALSELSIARAADSRDCEE